MDGRVKILTKHWQELLRDIRKHSSISLADLSLLVKNHTKAGAEYVIWRLQQEGVLNRVQGRRRGLFIVLDDGAKNGDGFVRDPIEAIHTLYGRDTLYCYGTALYIHGLSRYGRLGEYFVHSDVPRTRRPVGQVVVRFVKTRLGDNIGIAKRKHATGSLLVTDLERTIIDCIHRPAYAQGWENVVHALYRAEQVNAGRLIEYVKKYGTPSLVAKVGLVLDRFTVQWKVPANRLDSLLEYLPRKPIRFGRKLRGSFNRKWNIYVPGDLLDE
jgi:predicted transcriptional regulator of viral defense system